MSTTPETTVSVILVNKDESKYTRPKKMPLAQAESLSTIHAGMRLSGPNGTFVAHHALMSVNGGVPFEHRP